MRNARALLSFLRVSLKPVIINVLNAIVAIDGRQIHLALGELSG
jgi:hypothetical protein